MKSKYAVIGFPVDHSLSPELHEAGFKAIGLDAVYHRINLRPEALEQEIAALTRHYHGWNVTYPLKEKIIPFLDVLSPEAEAIGAVNTVKNVEGCLYGYNTDGEGFVEALSARGIAFQGKRVVILGAGGAAKAIAATLAVRQAGQGELLILNRTEEKAQILARQITALGGQASYGPLARGGWLERVDLLIQTTSLGMRGERLPLSLKGINPSCSVIDIIYSPAITPFLAEAKNCGCQTANGLDMLLYQGALAWKIWLNREPPVSAMREALLQSLRR